MFRDSRRAAVRKKEGRTKKRGGGKSGMGMNRQDSTYIRSRYRDSGCWYGCTSDTVCEAFQSKSAIPTSLQLLLSRMFFAHLRDVVKRPGGLARNVEVAAIVQLVELADESLHAPIRAYNQRSRSPSHGL